MIYASSDSASRLHVVGSRPIVGWVAALNVPGVKALMKASLLTLDDLTYLEKGYRKYAYPVERVKELVAHKLSQQVSSATSPFSLWVKSTAPQLPARNDPAEPTRLGRP